MNRREILKAGALLPLAAGLVRFFPAPAPEMTVRLFQLPERGFTWVYQANFDYQGHLYVYSEWITDEVYESDSEMLLVEKRRDKAMERLFRDGGLG